MHQFFEEKGVEFLPLSAKTIKPYVDTGEPMDKAGSYGIQAGAAAFVKQVHGCYYHAVCFPALRTPFAMPRIFGIREQGDLLVKCENHFTSDPPSCS